MCGIAALQLRNPLLHPQMGSLLSSMMCQIVDRGPDSAGMAVYDTPGLVSAGTSTLSLLGKDQGLPVQEIQLAVAGMLPSDAGTAVRVVGDTTLVSAAVGTDLLVKAVSETLPGSTIIGRGEHVAVMKSVGHPMEIAADQFAIIQPYADRSDRLDTAIVVSTHATAAAAFAELERFAERVHGFGLAGDVLEMLVMDALRRPVVRGH